VFCLRVARHPITPGTSAFSVTKERTSKEREHVRRQLGPARFS
jgi:hypothetical protein